MARLQTEGKITALYERLSRDLTTVTETSKRLTPALRPV